MRAQQLTDDDTDNQLDHPEPPVFVVVDGFPDRVRFPIGSPTFRPYRAAPSVVATCRDAHPHSSAIFPVCVHRT